MALQLHPHLAKPDGDRFFTADVVDDVEFLGDERGSKRRRIEDFSHRYLKGETLVIQSAKLRGPFKTTRRKAQEEPRKRCEVQKTMKGILKRERQARPAEPPSPETLPEKTSYVVKEATREWLRRLEPPAGSPEGEGDISMLEDRLDGLEHRTPSKPSHPPSIVKKPTVNHVLRKNNLKLCFKEKKRASRANKTLASDSLLDLYDLDLSGNPAIRSNSQPNLSDIPPSLQVNVNEDSVRRDPESIKDGGDVKDHSERVDQTQDESPEPVPTPDIAQQQPKFTEKTLSLQVNVDKDSVPPETEAGNEERKKVDSAQEGQPSRLPTSEIVQEESGRAPLTSRTAAIMSSPVRKTVRIANGQENRPCDEKTPKEPPSLRPQHSRTLYDPTRKKEKAKKAHILHASPTGFHSPFVYRKASDEEKPKAVTTKRLKRRAATARFVEFGSSPVNMEQARLAKAADEPKKPESDVEEDVFVAEACEEVLEQEAPKDETPKDDYPKDEVSAEENREEAPKEAPNDAPKEEAQDAPESLPYDFSTQAALVTAQQAFHQQLVSPAKKSDIYNLLDPDPIFASQNTTPPPHGSPPTFRPITPFRFVNQEECKSEKSAAPPVSTQELFNAATPFAFSTVKKQKPRKSVTIGIPSLLNPNPKPAGIASLLNAKNISPTFIPTSGKLSSQGKDTSPTFTPSSGKPKNQIKSTSPTCTPVNEKPQSPTDSSSWGFTHISGRPQSVAKSASPRWTSVNSQSVSPRCTPINAKRNGDGDTTIADPTGMFDANEVVSGTPAISPSQQRKSRKRSSPLAVRAAPPTAPVQTASPSTVPQTVSYLSQSQPQARLTTTPSPLLQRRRRRRRRRSTSPSGTMSALLSTSGTRPSHSTLLPELPDAQQRSGRLLGDDEDVDVDEVVNDADTFLSTWDWRKELGTVGA